MTPMMDTYNTNDIPRPEDVKNSGGMANWRIAEGRIVRGRELDNTLVVAQYGVLGRLLRVGVHRGTLDDGRPYGKLECELQTREGVQSVGASLTSMMAAITLGEGLLAAKKGQLLKIEARRSAKLNRYGKYTTYANVYSVDPANFATVQLRESLLTGDATLDDVLEQIEQALRGHEAWAERPNRHEEEEQAVNRPAFEQFKDDVAKAGAWPAFDLARPAYVSMLEKLTGGKVKDIADPQLEPFWAQMREHHAKHAAAGTVPKALQAYLAPPEDHDPFDE